jgi:hypothetical protein
MPQVLEGTSDMLFNIWNMRAAHLRGSHAQSTKLASITFRTIVQAGQLPLARWSMAAPATATTALKMNWTVDDSLDGRVPACHQCTFIIIIMLPNQAIASTPSAPRISAP